MSTQEAPAVTSTAERLSSVLMGDSVDFMTVHELAEAADVSDQTVRNSHEELTDQLGVKSRNVDRTTVYWFDIDSVRDEVHLKYENLGRELHLERRSRVFEARGRWLGAADYALSEITDESKAVRVRAWLWHVLIDYMREAPHSFDPLNGIVDLPQSIASEYDYYMNDVPLFESEKYGRVTGLGDVTSVDGEIYREVRELLGDPPIDPGLLDDDDLDRIYPSLNSIVICGQHFDSALTDLMSMNW